MYIYRYHDKFLAEYLFNTTSTVSPYLWVGASYDTTRAHWYWNSTGERVIDQPYTHFWSHTTDPLVDPGSMTCLQMWTSPMDYGAWQRYVCYANAYVLGFICEQPP